MNQQYLTTDLGNILPSIVYPSFLWATDIQIIDFYLEVNLLSLYY